MTSPFRSTVGRLTFDNVSEQLEHHISNHYIIISVVSLSSLWSAVVSQDHCCPIEITIQIAYVTLNALIPHRIK